jgi:putative NIF3 family GTP cyclohydrolase 1 type 2
MTDDRDLSRRRFLALAGAGAMASGRSLTAAAPQAGRGGRAGLTVEAVMARVAAELPAPPGQTADGLKAGSAGLTVTGIATTAMATAAVIRQAAASGCNLVVTTEPTFFSRTDDPSPAPRADDPVFAGKRRLIEQQGVAVWRLRDAWAAHPSSPMTTALASALGWTAGQDANAPGHLTIPPARLRDLATHVWDARHARALRIVGDPGLEVRRVVLSPGASAPEVTFRNLAATDVILAGEAREWEGVEYVQDAIAAGMPKGMILAGRVLTEDPGMERLSGWLRDLFPGLRIRHVAAGDLYWRPSPSTARKGSPA